MIQRRKAFIAGLTGGLVGAVIGAVTAQAVTHGTLVFPFAAPGVFLLQMLFVDVTTRVGTSRPSADVLVPANAAAYAFYCALFASSAVLLVNRLDTKHRYPERLTRGSAMVITVLVFPVFLGISSAFTYFFLFTVIDNLPANIPIPGILIMGLLIAAAFGIAYLLARLLYYHLRWKKRPEDYPFCLKCGYNLTGNVSGICPECGTPVETE